MSKRPVALCRPLCKVKGECMAAEQLHVRMFGKLQVERKDRAVAGLDVRKVQELFCYLLLHRSQPHPRETLASLLWAEYPTAQSRTYLRKALWQLQTALNPDPGAATQLFLFEPDWVRLNADVDLWCDVAVFEETAARARGIRGCDLDPALVSALQAAVDLYSGDLLDGWYQDWCLYERERLQLLYLALLDKLVAYAERHQLYELGIAYGVRILRCDRAHESTHRGLMRLHAMSGDRTAALRQYERCRAALHEELGVEPEDDTMTLYRRICANQPVDHIGASPPILPASSHNPLRDVLEHLRRYQVLLADVQRQVQQDIEVVERHLPGHGS